MLWIGWIIIFCELITQLIYWIFVVTEFCKAMGPRLFPPLFFLFSVLFEIQTQPFFIRKIASPSSPLKRAFSLWGFNPVKDGYKKSPGLFLGLAWAWEEWRVKDAGFENMPSQMLTPLPTAIQLHLIVLPQWLLFMPNLKRAELGDQEPRCLWTGPSSGCSERAR